MRRQIWLKPQTHFFSHAEAEPPEQESSDGSLIPAPVDSLSPQHSAVFLFGCQVMQLLANGPLFPSVLLLPAKSLPVSPSLSGSPLLAACWREFHFDAINQILYLSEAQLGHVGHFLATLLQSMAYITSGNQTDGNRVLSDDETRRRLWTGKVRNLLSKHDSCFSSNPGSEPQQFMDALREAISVVGLQLFNLSLKRSGAEVRQRVTHHSETTCTEMIFTFSFQSSCDMSQWQHGSLVEELLNVKGPTDAQFTERLLASRWVRKMKPAAQPRTLSYIFLPVLFCLGFKSTITSNWNNSSPSSNNTHLRTQTEVRDVCRRRAKINICCDQWWLKWQFSEPISDWFITPQWVTQCSNFPCKVANTYFEDKNEMICHQWEEKHWIFSIIHQGSKAKTAYSFQQTGSISL